MESKVDREEEERGVCCAAQEAADWTGRMVWGCGGAYESLGNAG
jgi:hypothetical protein